MASDDLLIEAGAYYQTYSGHEVRRLATVEQHLRRIHTSPEKEGSCLFLAGDSSLDNKHWLFPGFRQASWTLLNDQERGHFTGVALNGYERVLSPPRMVMDVCYWMNRLLLDEQKSGTFCLNTSVEATTLTSRVGGVQCCCVPACGGLYRQDKLIRERIRPQDYLVICVGGNDVALAPSIFTILFLVILLLTPWFLICACHPSILYFKLLFHYQLECYAKKLTSRTRPRKVGVCMIYNLDEAMVESWANAVLNLVCYSCFPRVLQYRMNLAFEYGIRMVNIPGTEVVPIALAEALDGSDTNDYLQRVEPSIQGGRKIANLVLSKLGLRKTDTKRANDKLLG